MVQVSSSALRFSSNEDGLTQGDVTAMCDLGASTKTSKYGTSIGHKGLGFKSVFLLSRTPHVAGGGFSFKFDTAKYGDYGLLVPSWLKHEVSCAWACTWLVRLCVHVTRACIRERNRLPN